MIVSSGAELGHTKAPTDAGPPPAETGAKNSNIEAATAPLPLWRAGATLAASPAIGPDGAIYVASRQGTLDVIEASGAHRFSITLGGAPTGAIFVDERGSAYIGLATGTLVAVTAVGQKTTLFRAPQGIRGGIGFAAGQGLLFVGADEVVLGINRGGFPTLRLRLPDRGSAGPIGIVGWCVVGTSQGVLVWGDRWGKRKRVEVGSALRELQATANGEIWALADSSLLSYSTVQKLLFRRSGILAMATAPKGAAAAGPSGAVLSVERQFEWLDASGQVLTHRTMDESFEEPEHVVMRLDGEGKLWIVERDTLSVVARNDAPRAVYRFPSSTLLEPVFDSARRRSIISTGAGAVYGVAWPESTAPDSRSEAR